MTVAVVTAAEVITGATPATSISNHPRRKSFVSNYLKYAFNALTEDDEDKVIENVQFSSLQEGFDDNNGTIVYMININDTHNIIHHAEPFFKQFDIDLDLTEKQLTKINNIFLCMDDWGEGHRYPPAPLLKKLFLDACTQQFDWKSDSLNDNLTEIISQ